MRLKHIKSSDDVAGGDVLAARDGASHTFIDFYEDGEGSHWVLTLPVGKRGVRNQEEHRPQFFMLEVAGG